MERLVKTKFFFSLQENKKINVRELNSNYDEFVMLVLSSQNVLIDKIAYRKMLACTYERLTHLAKKVQKKDLFICSLCD